MNTEPTTQPLADRMRPQSLDEIVGQEHLTGDGTLIRNMLDNNTLRSMILWGPPGVGKTSIANAIANSVNGEFVRVNATTSGKKDLEAVCTKAQQTPNKLTVLFVDEIHRFNKAQQDYLLSFVERGDVILIGATTENPAFEVISPLLSRCYTLELKPVSANLLKEQVLKALQAQTQGLGSKGQTIDPEALELLSEQACGDVRRALNLLELASDIASGTQHAFQITTEDVESAVLTPQVHYDHNGDRHYDIISAFIKSMRGSDPDAVLYYLAVMLQGGEDPKFIARRIVIAASEDVGNADPQALMVAVNAFLAVERVGMPEGRIILAHAATYVALAPKSNSACVGIDKAMAYVAQHPVVIVPPALQDAHYKSANSLGRGIGYDYPHNHPNHWVKQQYLPDGVNETFYESDHMGYQIAQDRLQEFIKHTP